MTKSKIYLTGAGPGDEGLITLRAKDLLERADIVVYDYLVNPSILDFCKPSAEKIYVGKKAGSHSLKQPEINQLLIELAQSGKMIVRLKGGDPFVFGRGAEEALALLDAGIEFEVVPGVTSGIAAPAYAGIPVTHRDFGSTLTFVTGHEAEGKTDSDIDWPLLAKTKGTLVFYMGIGSLRQIAENLISSGKDAQTEVALVRYGTWPQQEVLSGMLSNIADLAESAKFQPPALIVVGQSVSLRSQLNWFEKRALSGKRILVTRSRKQASVLSKQLRELGAEVIELPTIEIKPAEDYSPLTAALKQLQSYKWLIFTSVNGVELFFHKLFENQLDVRSLAHCKIATIGNETAIALRKQGVVTDLIPSVFTSEGIAHMFESRGENLRDARVLIPSSNIANPFLPEKLREMGALVDCVSVYQTIQPQYDAKRLNDIFSTDFDFVTFTSSSTVSNFVALMETHGLSTTNFKGVSIGPVTTKTAKELGVEIVAESKVHTIAGLVQAIENMRTKFG